MCPNVIHFMDPVTCGCSCPGGEAECRPGSIWDFYSCSCIPIDCDDIECPGMARMNTDSCECQCDVMVKCREGYYFDREVSCSCVEMPVCEKACMAPWTLDTESCECKCDIYPDCVASC
jgi:hypothetical protein